MIVAASLIAGLSEATAASDRLMAQIKPCNAQFHLGEEASSNGVCRDGWNKLIRLQLDSRHRPCSIVEVMACFDLRRIKICRCWRSFQRQMH